MKNTKKIKTFQEFLPINYKMGLNLEKINRRIQPTIEERRNYEQVKKILLNNHINTVCISANCPNRYKCFGEKKATFMILGEKCTRRCKYCDVWYKSREKKFSNVDPEEGKRIANIVKLLGLKYVVITSVTRDDLPDKGVNHFINVVRSIKEKNDVRIELLIPDFKGNPTAIDKLLKTVNIDILNHNIEVVKRLYPSLRPGGDYELALKILEKAKEYGVITKSGIIVGVGESKDEIIETMKDLRNVGCDILTIGQYFRPNKECIKVEKYYNEEEFKDLKKIGEELGFKYVFSGILVRSSFHAEEIFNKIASNNKIKNRNER